MQGTVVNCDPEDQIQESRVEGRLLASLGLSSRFSTAQTSLSGTAASSCVPRTRSRRIVKYLDDGGRSTNLRSERGIGIVRAAA